MPTQQDLTRRARLLLPPALLLGALSTWVFAVRPLHNWDLLGYVGASLSEAATPPAEVQRRALARVREAVSVGKYRLMTEANAYRRAVASDPRAFAQQLPYYTSKPAYVWLMRLGTKSGLHPVSANVAISRIAYLALGLSIWWWLQLMVGAWVALGASVLAMALPGVLELARLSTPDGLSVFVTLNGLMLLVERQRAALACGLLLLALTIRLDNIVWLPFVAAYLLRGDRRRLGPVAAWLAAAVLLYVAIVQWSGFYGWRQLLYTNFIERLPYPADRPDALMSWGEYARLLVRSLHPAQLPRSLAVFTLLGGLTLWARGWTFGPRDRWTQLVAGCLLFLATHFVLYPAEDRFLVAGYLVLLIALIRTVHELAQAAPGRAPLAPA